MTDLAAAELAQIPMSQELAGTLARASEGARATGAPEVSLEHVLAALCDDPDAADVLSASHIDVPRLKAEVIAFLVRQGSETGRQSAPGGSLVVSAALRRILEAAAAAARGGRRRDINGAIVLAAIVGDGRSAAAQMLQQQGLTFDGAIRALQSALAQPAREATQPVAPAEDVLARARERVQSRSAPSLREILLDKPRPAPAPPPKQGFPDFVPPHGGYGDMTGGGFEAESSVEVDETQPAPAAAPAPAQAPVPMGYAPEAPAEAAPSPPAEPVAAEETLPHDAGNNDQWTFPAPPPVNSKAEGASSAPSWQPASHEAPAQAPASMPPLGQYAPGAPPPQTGPAPEAKPVFIPQTQPAPAQPHAVSQPQPVPDAPPPGQPFPQSQPAGYPQPGGSYPPGPALEPRFSAPSIGDGPMGGGFGYPAPPPSALPTSAPATSAPVPLSPSQPSAFDRGRPGSPMPPPIPPPIPRPGSQQVPQHAPHGYGAPPSARAPQPRTAGPMSPANMAPANVGPANHARPAQGHPPAPPMTAPSASAAREAASKAELGQLAENVPRSMRVGVSERVEIRIGRGHVQAITEGLEGGGLAWRHEVTVTKAMSVRLRAPEGGFFIETASPETQWIDNQFNDIADDFASWRFMITPQKRGWARLQIIVSARTVGADGLAAETAFPDQVVEVKVRTNYARAFKRLSGWLVAAIAGGALAKFGEGAFESGASFFARFLH